MKFSRLVSHVSGKPVSVAEALTGRATKWIMDKFGVSRSTAQRWKSGRPSHPGGPPSRPKGSKADDVMQSADRDTRRKIAAGAMRNATAVNVGVIEVDGDTDRCKGKRNLGTVQLTEAQRAKMAEAAEATEAGNMEDAERLHSEALLGGNYGPLRITDYNPGFGYI